MSGRPAKVDHLRDAFAKRIESATQLSRTARAISGINPQTAFPRLNAEHARRVVELAFLGVLSAWEDFLEQSMTRYLAGARCDGGYLPPLRLGRARDIAHAYQILSGDPSHNPDTEYLRFSDPSSIGELAVIFFEAGRPYRDALQPREDLLRDALKIRNRIAHSSQKCRADFKKVALRHLGRRPGTALPQGYSPGDLLTRRAERHFGKWAKDNGVTVFDAYMDLYNRLALKIVPRAQG